MIQFIFIQSDARISSTSLWHSSFVNTLPMSSKPINTNLLSIRHHILSLYGTLSIPPTNTPLPHVTSCNVMYCTVGDPLYLRRYHRGTRCGHSTTQSSHGKGIQYILLILPNIQPLYTISINPFFPQILFLFLSKGALGKLNAEEMRRARMDDLKDIFEM